MLSVVTLAEINVQKISLILSLLWKKRTPKTVSQINVESLSYKCGKSQINVESILYKCGKAEYIAAFIIVVYKFSAHKDTSFTIHKEILS